MPSKKDLTNQKFGKLLVIKEVPFDARPDKRKVYWECQCECGNTSIVPTSYLTTGHTTSCGCRRAEAMAETMSTNLLGKKYGKLVVIEKTNERASDGCIIWKCLCECGNITYTNTNSLKNGDTQSCGCIRSKGERKINEILFANEINFQTQYWFKDLKDKKYLYFDFGILDDEGNLKCLIEYQGEQHFFKVFPEEWNDFTIKHDRMKREYCEKNNIKLIEIPYTDFNKIDFNYLKNKLNF